MRTFADVLQYVNVAAFAALALVCYRAWRRERSDPARWAFLTFALLGAVSVAGPVIDALAGADPGVWLDKLIIALVVLFPYFLFRFAASFGRPTWFVEAAAAALTGIIVVWTLALPDVPEEGEPRPNWFFVYIVALLVQWTALSLYMAVRLWWAGRGQPSVVRHRMRFLALAAVALSLLLVALGLGPEDPSAALEAVESIVTLAITLMFFVGFAPPLILRELWRQPEERVLREGIDELVRFAATPADILARVLPRMASLVGARGVALVDEKGTVLGTHGAGEEVLEREQEPGVVRLPIASGSLVVWTNPYAPFFGAEEFVLLRSLGSLTVLALERSRLYAQEHEARVALEEAGAMKSQFVALASHELRTPVAVIHGIGATLHMRGDE